MCSVSLPFADWLSPLRIDLLLQHLSLSSPSVQTSMDAYGIDMRERDFFGAGVVGRHEYRQSEIMR